MNKKARQILPRFFMFINLVIYQLVIAGCSGSVSSAHVAAGCAHVCTGCSGSISSAHVATTHVTRHIARHIAGCASHVARHVARGAGHVARHVAGRAGHVARARTSVSVGNNGCIGGICSCSVRVARCAFASKAQ